MQKYKIFQAFETIECPEDILERLGKPKPKEYTSAPVEFEKEDVDEIVKIVSEISSNLEYQGEKEYRFEFRNRGGYFCPIHKRNHDNQNPFVFSFSDSFFFDCRQRDKTTEKAFFLFLKNDRKSEFIGKVPEENTSEISESPSLEEDQVSTIKDLEENNSKHFIIDFVSKTEKKWSDLISHLEQHCKKWIFQTERGANGIAIYRGRFSLKERMRFKKIKETFSVFEMSFSKTSQGYERALFYNLEEANRVSGPWKNDEQTTFIPFHIQEMTTLFPWQTELLKLSKIVERRRIDVIIDKQGNKGKSDFGTYIGVHKLGIELPFFNDYKDLMSFVMSMPKTGLYIIDLPRALKKDKLSSFFAGVETLKKGYAFDPRYKGRFQYFNIPNIWIFMNKEPDLSLLTQDRWRLWNINEERELIAYEKDE